MTNDFILELVYESKYQSNYLIASGIVDALEESGVNLQDFLYGLGILLDLRQQSDAAALIQRASNILKNN